MLLRRRIVAAGILVVALVALVAVAIVPLASRLGAATDDRPPLNAAAFDPGLLIEDAAFYDGAAMTATEIQDFLDEHIGRCATDSCLNVLRADLPARAELVSDATGQTICGPWEGGELSAAEIIERVQQACGISAKVLLVMLQKEQSLVAGATARDPAPEELAAAMGARCPDDAPCDPGRAGFADQVAQGATDLAAYRASEFMRQPGVHFIAYSPDPACGGSEVRIANDATAALYNYTPYQPNAAALAAGWDEGDACSSYGNRNFAWYWAAWFA